MKKKILSLILVAIMLISAMPIAVLAANDSSGTQIADQNDTRPAVKIKSADCYDDGRYDEFRALPEEDGTFYIDIYLEEGQTPADNGNVIVYYRTVDDSAVAEWGDYDGSAAMGDSFVVLNKDNGYSARVIIKSIILEEGLYTNDNKGNPNQKKIVTRRFLFELIDVTDNAKFDSRREMYCYLRAKHYTFSQDDAQIKSSFKAKYDYIGRLTKDMHEYHSWYPSMVERANKFAEEIKYFSIFYEPLSYYEPKTPEIKYKGSYSNTLDQTFSDEIRNYLQTGWCDLGLSLYGKIVRDFWDSDGEATLHLYYTYNGKRMTAVSLYLEGEFDDSEYLGWEKAFEYALEYDGQAIRKDEDAWDEIYDHMYDNFIGFTLYDNDGNVACEIKMGEDRSDGDVAKVVNQLKDALRDGHAVKYSNLFRVRDGDPWEYNSDCYSYYLRLPSNYAYADSYSFEFISDSTDEDEIRWIPWCDMDYVLIKNGQPKIVADEAGNQKITTNLDTLKIGDPLRMGIRFDKPVHVANKNNDCYILVDIYNSTGCIAKDVRLNLSQLSATNNGSYNYYAWDTLVFESEGALSDLVSNGKISSLRNIRLYDGSEAKENPSKGIRCFLTNESLYSKRISDLYGFDKDMRTPVASLAMSVPEGWSKTRSVGICVNILDNGSTRFNDYVTVYYQWSNSDKLPDPDSYTSSIVFNTAKDGEIVKYITGTGNGETFLHMKAVSSFGKSSVSVMRTDPDKDYVPYGPFLFDNTPPTLSGVSVSSDLKVRTLTVPLPDDGVGSGFKDLSLYYISKGGEERLLGKYTADSFKGDSKTLTVTVSHESVGVGVDLDGNKTLERRDIDFYWVTTDVIGNKSDKISPITLTFDTNDYLDNAIKEVGPYNVSDGIDDAEFKNTTKEIDGKTFIYDRKLNENKDIVEHPSLNKNVYYGFSFKIDKSEFGSEDIGVYTAEVYYLGEKLTDYALREESNGVYVVWFFNKMRSGRYDIKLIRTEETGVRISHTYSVYSTMGEDDSTALKKKIESGTLLNNIVYQLTTDFYYKDGNGTRKQVSYSGIKQRATFSSLSKAREYVYFRELGDIYLVQLTNEMAEALNGNGTTGYMKATGETMIPMAGQYWIRYKSEAWMPGSGDSYWVYYYYGSSSSGSLYEGSFSPNLQMALNTVSNRIANMGETVMLTDISLLGATPATSMLDKYGMPYLLDEQIYDDDEVSESTVCGNLWSMPIAFAGDLNIYKSSTYTYNAGSILEKEYPIIGNVALPEDSRFQYMTYENYSKPDSQWVPLDIKKGESFIDVLTTWGIYYIREMSADGVAVYAIFVDKDAPRITFTHTDESGTVKEIFASGSGTVNIETKNLYIGRISSSESDRFSYVAVYKASTNTLVGIYTASDLDSASVKIEDGNYKIVVADRSGNHYTVSARVSSSSLECPITESTDKHIKITCERRPDEILRYEVYLNGELLTSQYENTKTFTSAGRYTLYVQDIYGNIVSEEYVFKRSYPEVTWKYQGTDGLYHTYNYDNPPKDTDGFIMKQISDNQHKISTAVKTRFAFSDGYVYDFIGAAPSHTPSLTENAVTIEAGQSFTLKVYYKNHPDCYTLYSAVVDVTPPSISVSADVDVLKNGEYGLFQEWAKGNVGDIIEMEEIYYLLSEVGHRTVSNGAVISSDIIRINVSDANDLSSVAVYLDGELIKQQDSGFSEIIVSRWGDYKIVAKDSLGNVAEFNFTNGKPDGISYFVDGAEKETDLHGYRNFENANGKHIYTNVDYGNSEFRLDITKNADVFVSVGASGESTKVFGFRISDGKIYRLIYTIVLDKNGNKAVELTVGEVLLDATLNNFEYIKEYSIGKIGTNEIFAAVGADGMVSLKIYADSDPSKILSVNARVEFSRNHTIFVSSEISQKSSNISFKENGVQTNTDIRVNVGFTVEEAWFDDERIESISLYYSELNDLDVNNLNGKADIYTTDKQYTDEGFYMLVVRNLYGNCTVYKIAISRSFGVTSSVTFGDGHRIYYSKDYDGKLYSNDEITLDLLDDNVTISATLNGMVYTGFAQRKDDVINYLVFSEEGTYVVTLIDSYGNTITRRFEINKSTYTVTEELLTGYNEKALKRSEGYTNQKLSIDKAVYDKDGIYYLAFEYEDTLTVIFDSFSEQPVITSEKDLVDIIGSKGDGVYKVICRNRYGAVVTKDIHYRSTPTLKLERTTRSQTESEIYDLDYAVALGFWSNNTLNFSTDAKTYVFTINGSVTECPRTIVFENSGDYGSFEYDITYVDEYGFEYSFKAYLVRKNITIDVPSNISGVEIDGVLNTKNDISILFGENIFATYTRNNGEEILYRSGDVLKKDGVYRFTVVDYAGNTSKITIKKDTIAEFTLVESNTGLTVLNGSIVNTSKVAFNTLNKDSAYIEKVLKDGVVQTEFSGTKFTEDGKWELIISDKLGNKAYFYFFIVTREQNGFSYTTPYEYQITEMWYDSGDGVKVSYMNFVNHTDFTSSFNFTENGTYTVVMTSEVTGTISTFDFTINTNAPEVSLVGCNIGETTINDVTIAGWKVGDRIKIFKTTDDGDVMIEEIEVTSLSTKIPTITEGGKYRIVVESEAGVATELTFVRKHVMNTAGSIFILIIILLSVIGLFTGLVYRNKSKTDD